MSAFWPIRTLFAQGIYVYEDLPSRLSEAAWLSAGLSGVSWLSASRGKKWESVGHV